MRRESAVRVDEELDVVADRLAGGVEAHRVALGLAPDLHLHARDPGLRPTAELVTQPLVCVGAEAAAAVDRDVLMRRAQQDDERHAEQARLQVPQGLIDRRRGAEADPRLSGVADLRGHAQPGGAHVHRVLALDHARELGRDHLGGGRVAVRVAEACLLTRVRLDDDDRRRVPLERPVRLRLVGRDRVCVDFEPLDGRCDSH